MSNRALIGGRGRTRRLPIVNIALANNMILFETCCMQISCTDVLSDRTHDAMKDLKKDSL